RRMRGGSARGRGGSGPVLARTRRAPGTITGAAGPGARGTGLPEAVGTRGSRSAPPDSPATEEMYMDVPILDDHPRKIRVSEVRPDPTLEATAGWVDMAVQWIVTRHSVGSERTVFGITTMPPGGRHEIHRHPHAEEV